MSDDNANNNVPPPPQPPQQPPPQPPQQPPQPPQSSQQQVPNYLVQSILVTLFCCLPLGVVAIIFAAQVNSQLSAGNYQAALDSSNKARLFCWISFGLGIAWIGISLIMASLGMMPLFWELGQYQEYEGGQEQQNDACQLPAINMGLLIWPSSCIYYLSQFSYRSVKFGFPKKEADY